MRPQLVVFDQPGDGDLPHLHDPLERLRARHLVPTGTVESLDAGALVRFARLDVAQRDVTIPGPVDEGMARQFAAISSAGSAYMRLSFELSASKGSSRPRAGAVQAEKPSSHLSSAQDFAAVRPGIVGLVDAVFCNYCDNQYR